jgi:hypothetical protein
MILNFDMEQQIKPLWCWAATAKSVSHFYLQSSQWTQCQIASSELAMGCCNNTFPADCDQVWYLDRALTRTNNYSSMDYSSITWNDILQELRTGRVIGARIQWRDGGGHFVIIYGATEINDEEYLYIDDPAGIGKSVVTFNQFLTNYRGDGKWTHTYYTN